MHAYDVPRRQSYQPIPSARSAQDPSSGGPSATPIYDALYAEWVRSYRALPGDRHGEEELGFTAFGNPPYNTGSYGGRHGAAAFATGHLASQQSARQEQQQSQAATATSVWQPVGRMPTGHTGMHRIPAALPPAPRRGL
ncbi:hypothetical protein [Streptomyces sp. NPDC002845]